MSRKTSKRSKKKKKAKKGKPSKVESPTYLFLEYYQPVFLLLHEALAKSDHDASKPHSMRISFWHLVPPGKYEPHRARPLVEEYLKLIEKELASLISKHSIAYWLHIYRRLSPGAVGADKQPGSIGITRAVLEAAIQKYGQVELCDGVGFSSEIPEDSILDGMLMHPSMESARQHLKEMPQLVLTKFGLRELIEFYDAESLAYEIWRSGAQLRILGKGAPLVVQENRELVYDDRSDELADLVRIFDKRLGGDWHSSATGTVFPERIEDSIPKGGILLPMYDLTGVSSEIFSRYFYKLSGIQFAENFRTNFVWVNFNLRGYLQSHEPFASAFEEKHGVSLETVIAVVASLWCRAAFWIKEVPDQLLVKYWQRAYEGPYKEEYILDEIKSFLPMAMRLLDLGSDENRVDVLEGMLFWKLSDKSKRSVDLAYPGPHVIFLPCGSDRLFIDYAWILRRCFDFFYGLSIPDQSFKGEALERLVHQGRSVLPTSPCKSLSGQSKQIDAAFEAGDTLVIVECKAVARSIAFDRGDPTAINFRCEIVDRALSEVDEKARWLSQNPVGRNYDLRRFERILPLASTPFVEYIPTLDKRYWLKDGLPRVLKPSELELALKDGTLEELAPDCPNSISISTV